MIGVFVTFRYQSDFDGTKIRKIAETARSRFEKMHGLHSRPGRRPQSAQPLNNLASNWKGGRNYSTLQLSTMLSAQVRTKPPKRP